MLTGDAASRHGHEFSPQQSPATTPSPTPTQQRRLPLTRSPLSFLPSQRQRSPHGPSPLGPGKRPFVPRRSQSVRVTMAELREEPDEESEEESDFLQSVRMPGAYHGSVLGYRNSPPLVAADSPLVVETDNTPEAIEVEEPEASIVTPTYTPTPIVTEEPDPLVSKRVRRPRTTYRFAHPPPPTRPLGKKGILRPKVLLQLQERADSGFHRPIYEVVPASRYAPITKVGQKLQRLHKGKDGLAADDLVVVQAEDYKTSDSQSEEVEISDSRDVLGMISGIPGETESALLSLENSVWKATAGVNGSYTLVQLGEHSQTARWYIPKSKRTKSFTGDGLPSAIEDDRKFYFTSISPDTTKHPTIASMTSSKLDVYDEYSTSSTPGEVITTDDLLRKLITVSGAWVFFREGWSSSYKSNPAPKPVHGRTVSMPLDPTRRHSAFCRTPSRSPTPVRADNASPSLESKVERNDSLVPPKRSPSPLSISLSEKRTQSDATSLAALEGNSRASSCTEQVPHFMLPRAQTTSNLEDKQRKRRSWSHHEMSSFHWPSTITSLSRRMSIKEKTSRPAIVDPVTITTTAPTPTKTKDGGNRSSRHLRRISQTIRRPLTPRSNIGPTEFGEVEFRAIEEPLKRDAVPFVDGSEPEGTNTSPKAPPIAVIVQDIMPVKDRPITPISNTAHATTETQEMTPPPDPTAPKEPEVAVQPITPRRPLPLPIESTETLISAVNYTYWQQYDRLISRHMESPPDSPPQTSGTASFGSTEVPKPQTHRLEMSPPVAVSSVVSPAMTHTVTSTTHTGRKVSWTERLKSKLHHHHQQHA